MSYVAPVARMLFDLEHIAGLPGPGAAGADGLDYDSLRQVLEEAGRFAASELAPINVIGDREGARFENGVVRLPKEFRAAYRAWAEAGWNSVDAPVAEGGMGLPFRIATAVMEMWASACMSFAMGPVLSQGAVDVLLLHASADLKRRYLPKLISGEWMATMNLTEPQAGSDLGALRTRAERAGDGTYRIRGQKIFISFGEHDLTDNIIHLVLARLPDAPPGTRGISLFLVPKIHVRDDGAPGAHNDVRCAGIEHKTGIHASPTCTMVYGDGGGAVGYLIGEEHKGLACMFTMMNKARLYTGLQGVCLAERALQQATAFAFERRQGRPAGEKESVAQAPIITHPDVRRNLMTMRALTAAARGVAYYTAGVIDAALHGGDAASRAASDERAGLLTPIVKAFCTEAGVEVTSLNVQIHGGMGYVEETGAIQHWRDSRIAPIYEGTNGIQAIDLVTRKITRGGGRELSRMLAEWRVLGVDLAAQDIMPARSAGQLGAVLDMLDRATAEVTRTDRAPDDILAVATPYLRLFSLAAGAATLAQGALAAAGLPPTDPSWQLGRRVIEDARFYYDNILPMAGAHFASIEAGSASVCLPESFQ
ncbi:MAG: acyl-CoA dehydrogenase [Xanthobacteraceae bacterium]|nr:MAG: acyl-CoA dehydrogenase [Xanthobacteraceae bacterium]